MIKKIILPVVPIVIFILLATIFFLINKQSCFFDSYDYIDDENPLKNELGQEITLKGLPHYFKGDYWLESEGKSVCLIVGSLNQKELIERFQNYAKENARSEIKKEIQLKGTVKKDVRCFLPCSKNSVTQLKCSEVKQKELHYCVRVKKISE